MPSVAHEELPTPAYTEPGTTRPAGATRSVCNSDGSSAALIEWPIHITVAEPFNQRLAIAGSPATTWGAPVVEERRGWKSKTQNSKKVQNPNHEIRRGADLLGRRGSARAGSLLTSAFSWIFGFGLWICRATASYAACTSPRRW